MKISIYALYAKERFETVRQHSILHPKRVVGSAEIRILARNSAQVLALRLANVEFSDRLRAQPGWTL
jgi:hypothetical protein